MTWEEAVRWLLSQPAQQDLIRDCYYDMPRAEAARRYRQSDEWKAIRNYCPRETGQALDIGAGHGITSYALAMDGWRVTAIEPDPSPLVGAVSIQRLASDENLPITVLRALAERIPIGDDTFHLVLARQALHHARDLPALCAEIFRVLKPGGIFIAAREHVVSRRSHVPEFLARHPLHRLYGGENAYLLSEYLTALKNGGFLTQHTLRPFDTAINYAPQTKHTLRQEIRRRIGKLPGGLFLFDVIFPEERGSKRLLKFLSLCDRRPGRLYSFVCKKPDRLH